MKSIKITDKNLVEEIESAFFRHNKVWQRVECPLGQCYVYKSKYGLWKVFSKDSIEVKSLANKLCRSDGAPQLKQCSNIKFSNNFYTIVLEELKSFA